MRPRAAARFPFKYSATEGILSILLSITQDQFSTNNANLAHIAAARHSQHQCTHLTTSCTQDWRFLETCKNRPAHKLAPTRHVTILARRRAIHRHSSRGWLRSVLSGPYLSRGSQLVLGLGLALRSGLHSLAARRPLDVPDGILPSIPSCNSASADMADLRASGDFRRYRA